MIKTPLRKMIFASTLFLAMLSTSAVIVAVKIEEIAKYIQINLDSKEVQIQGETLPYRALGRVPISSSKEFAPSSRYTLEIAIYDNQLQADKALESLNAQGFDAYYTPFQAGNGIRYKVRVGIFKQSQTAMKTRSNLEKHGIKSSIQTL